MIGVCIGIFVVVSVWWVLLIEVWLKWKIEVVSIVDVWLLWMLVMRLLSLLMLLFVIIGMFIWLVIVWIRLRL